ncbi:CBS domain-containing protein [Cytobacillus suaedae]|nr:CBS domain-containing protein [Cytobacillus suaedae]
MEKMYEKVKFHPIFRGVEQEEAMELLTLCQLRNYEKLNIIFHADKQREGLLLLLSGIAEVYVASAKTSHREEVLEVVEAGEMIGFSSLADFLGVSKKDQKAEQIVEVRAIEKVEALYIPFSVIAKRWGDQDLHDYLLAQVSVRLKDVYVSLAEQVKLARQFGESEAMVVRVQDLMTSPAITVTSKDTIKAVAEKMTSNRTSSVLVTDQETLTGIITEQDLISRVIANPIVDSNDFASKIMTASPITISRFAYYYDALSKLILNGKKHLPVVDEQKVIGVITLSDLLRKKNENMVKAIQRIEKADEDTLPEIKQAIYGIVATLIHGKVPILHTLDVVTTLYDRLVERCINLAISNCKKQGLKSTHSFCFFQMGSSGRKEQFQLTDQDHFLVYEDGGDESYFTSLAHEIVRLLGLAGYAKCKGDMMASNPLWRGSISQWQNRIHSWTLQSTNQNLLLAQNFFSYRLLCGSIELYQKFEKTIKEQLSRGKIFYYRLTELEKENQITLLEHPIRAIFRLERKQVDMKKEVLFPFHHSLQILSLLNGILSGTPMERLEKLVEKKVLSLDFAKDVQLAFSGIMTVYVKQRWQQHEHQEPITSTIQFTHLTSREKEELMLSLKTLRELQRVVFSYF